MLNEDVGKLGAGGIRAIATAFLGTGPNFHTGAYKQLQSIRLWKCFVGDDGAASLAQLLIQGADQMMMISYLELMDCKVGRSGCQALGEALDGKHKSHLLNLKIHYNAEMGDEGVSALCRGLFTNRTLKQLHLDYCNIGPSGAQVLGQALSMPKSELTVMSLHGNSVGSGLKYLAKGLKRCPALTTLNLSDNAIGQDLEALEEFREALLHCTSLSFVDLTLNRLNQESAAILMPVVACSHLKTFLVDATLPPAVFAKLNRTGGSDKGGSGKKKAGKKKK